VSKIQSIRGQTGQAIVQPCISIAGMSVAPFLLFSSYGSQRAAHQDSPSHGFGRVAPG
jgi:hypothetical protein